jgi:hypothetical protein
VMVDAGLGSRTRTSHDARLARHETTLRRLDVHVNWRPLMHTTSRQSRACQLALGLVLFALIAVISGRQVEADWALETDEVLYVNDTLISGNGTYRLIVHNAWIGVGFSTSLELCNISGLGFCYWASDYDGDFSGQGGHQDQWANVGTSGYLTMQSDGNVVLYNGAGTVAGWSTSTYNNAGAYLNVQDDGNLVVYTSSHSPVWSLY